MSAQNYQNLQPINTSIAQTIVKYTNGLGGSIGSTVLDTFISCFSQSETFVNSPEIEIPVPINCIAKNARMFVNIMESSTNVLLRLRVNGVTPDPNSSTGKKLLEVDIEGTGLKVSNDTETKLNAGDLICWDIQKGTGGVPSSVAYLTMELVPI